MNAIWVKSSLSFSNGNWSRWPGCPEARSAFATAGIPGAGPDVHAG